MEMDILASRKYSLHFMHTCRCCYYRLHPRYHGRMRLGYDMCARVCVELCVNV